MSTGNQLSDDLLIGAKAIGNYLGLSPRKVYHWASTNKLPIFHIDKLIAARKSQLHEALKAKLGAE
jgi:hypothetical protein